MQADAERTLSNLHVLAALNHNDKLITNDESFDIYPPSTWRALYRTWMGERRNQNVQRVRHTVRAAIDFATKSLHESESLADRMNAFEIPAKMMTKSNTLSKVFRKFKANNKSVSSATANSLTFTYKGRALTEGETPMAVGIRDRDEIIAMLKTYSLLKHVDYYTGGAPSCAAQWGTGVRRAIFVGDDVHARVLSEHSNNVAAVQVLQGRELPRGVLRCFIHGY